MTTDEYLKRLENINSQCNKTSNSGYLELLFASRGGLIASFRGLGEEEEMLSIISPEATFKKVEKSIQNIIDRETADEKERKIAEEIWRSLTEEQKAALKKSINSL